VGGAGLELADEIRRHRVGQGSHGRLQSHRHLGGQRPGRGAAQHQPGDPLGVGHRHPPGGEGTPRVADQGDALDADGVQERHGVGGEVVDPVAAGRALGVAVATLVEGVGVVAGGQQGQDPAVGEPGVGIGGQEHDGLPAGVALLGVVDLGAGGKARGGEPGRWNGLLHGWPPGTPAGCDTMLILGPRRPTNARRGRSVASPLPQRACSGRVLPMDGAAGLTGQHAAGQAATGGVACRSSSRNSWRATVRLRQRRTSRWLLPLAMRRVV
jgi:hypothetical protein